MLLVNLGMFSMNEYILNIASLVFSSTDLRSNKISNFRGGAVL